MIVIRVLVAIDRRTISISQVSTNLSDVVTWLAGDSLPLSPWTVTLATPAGPVELGEVGYPVEVHQDFGEPTSVSSIRLSRTLGSNELYVDIKPVAVSGTRFDMRAEFKETENAD